MPDGFIDFHTHAHPTAATGIAFQERWGWVNPPRNGTPEELLPLMDQAGVATTMIVPWMPAQDLVRERMAEHNETEAVARDAVLASWSALNRWAVEMVGRYPGRLLCLVGVDPILMSGDELDREVRQGLAAGACGLKITPSFFGATASDARVLPVFQLAQEHGVFVLSESGAFGRDGNTAWGHPKHFEDVLRAFPDVDIQLAHLGGGAEDEVARLTALYPNLFADTSMRLDGLGQPGEWTPDEAVQWFRRIGIERVLYGTNYPMADPVEYVRILQSLPLTEEERRRIGWENAQGILDRSRKRREATG